MVIKLTGVIQWCAGKGLTVEGAQDSPVEFANWPVVNITTMAISRFQYDIMNTELGRDASIQLT